MMKSPRIALALLLMLTACAGLFAPAANLSFSVHPSVNAAGFTIISLEVFNNLERTFPGTDNFGGVLELRDSRLNLVAHLEIPSLPEMGAKNRAFPASWQGLLPPGSYEIAWGAPDYGYTRGRFRIALEKGRLRLLNEQTLDQASGKVENSPIALGYGELAPAVQAARTDLAERRNTSAEEIAVRELRLVQFQQGSSGELHPGYALRLAYQGKDYAYHLATGPAPSPATGAPPGPATGAAPGPATGAALSAEPTFAAELPPPDVPLVAITSVQAQPQQITVEGETTLPAGACLQTALFAAGQFVEWWPVSACIPAGRGAWTAALPLPEPLDRSQDYLLRAWWLFDPRVSASPFPFDLAGPPANPSPGR